MKHFVYVRKDGQVTHLVGAAAVMAAAGKAVLSGEGRFNLTIDGEQQGHDRTRVQVLDSLARQLALTDARFHTYRIRNHEMVVFTCREETTAAETIDTSGNDKADAYWSALKAEFPDATFLGSLVCKPDSQHRFGNAVDAGFQSPAMGEKMWEWAIDMRKVFWLRNAIVQKKIWHLGTVSDYYGEPHVTHTHADYDPTFDTSLPCGLRG